MCVEVISIIHNHLISRYTNISFFLCARTVREHGPARGRVEGVQPHGARALPQAWQRVHQEQGRLHPPPPLLPERAQPVLPQHPHHRLQA